MGKKTKILAVFIVLFAGGAAAPSFEMKGDSLFRRSSLVAKYQGNTLYNGKNQSVGKVRDNCLYGRDSSKIACHIQGIIFDNRGQRLGKMDDIHKDIKGATQTTRAMGFWIMFVR